MQEIRDGIDHDPVQPWNWATMPGRSDPVEIVSYPIPDGAGNETVMVRLTVGDPTSLVEVPMNAIAAFAPDRHHWFLRPRRYYGDTGTAFVFED
jgi:hypothetical protein